MDSIFFLIEYDVRYVLEKPKRIRDIPQLWLYFVWKLKSGLHPTLLYHQWSFYMFILADIWPDLYCIVVFRQAIHNAPITGACAVAVGATAIVCGAYSEKR